MEAHSVLQALGLEPQMIGMVSSPAEPLQPQLLLVMNKGTETNLVSNK